MAKDKASDETRVTIRQLTLLLLSIYVLGALFIDSAFRLPDRISELLNHIDTLVCCLFIADFFYTLIRAENRLAYLKWGWIDLVSSIPNLQILRWGRFVRVIHIIRILRSIRSTRRILAYLFANQARGTFASVAMISFVLVVFSSITILNCETAPGSNIKTASDALWWSFVTITTVGYGELYPVTTPGRVLAGILMVTGVGLFGTFTAYVASFFLQKGELRTESQIMLELRGIQKRLDELEKTGRTRD